MEENSLRWHRQKVINNSKNTSETNFYYPHPRQTERMLHQNNSKNTSETNFYYPHPRQTERMIHQNTSKTNSYYPHPQQTERMIHQNTSKTNFNYPYPRKTDEWHKCEECSYQSINYSNVRRHKEAVHLNGIKLTFARFVTMPLKERID